jgi:1,4-alpha-glucan branching enzyme
MPQRTRLGSWLLAPRDLTFSIRPLFAIAAAVVLAVAIGLATARGNRAHTASVAANAARAEPVLVSFRLEAPHAQNVALAGDFSNWTPAYAMRRSSPGVWTIVVPLSPGVHEYSFVVDGKRWVPDPTAVAKPDGFGGVNSRIAVLKPDKRA